MTVKLPFTGGCACGAVRYECTAEPFVMLRCHCKDCQQISGAPFEAVLYVPKEAFGLTKGALGYRFTEGEAFGQNKRGFCAVCGSRISGGESDRRVGIVAGSLDDSAWFRAQMDIFTQDAQPGDLLDPDVPKFEQYPPRRRSTETAPPA